jgi:hypothetical protein
MVYKILPYSIKKANQYNLELRPSQKKRYKIDVYYLNNYLDSIGQANAGDYPTYMEYEKNKLVPKGYADERRRLYYIRHEKDYKEFSRDWLSKLILW